VLIVDDHPAFRSMARLLLEAEGLEIVGEANDGDEAVAASTALRPGVVLLDIHLPGDDGFAVAERLAALPSPPIVVLISSRPAADMRGRLGSTSAVGFIHKSDLSVSSIAGLVG
jgi:DNA-binding NarL/FixJ family response regulator